MKAELTKKQKVLIHKLDNLGATLDSITVIFILLPRDDQLEELEKFLDENPNATESDVLGKTLELTEEQDDENL